MFYVYKIINKINNKIYVGQTTETLKKRFKRHCGYQLNNDDHLHRAMKKYGIENFSIELIEEVNNQEELDEREYYWIQYYNAINEGYNIKDTKGKCGGDTLSNNKNLKIIKQKLSNSKKGKLNPNARKIKAINIETKTEYYFDTLKECQLKLNIPYHSIISKRCRHIIKKPYQNLWIFEYID